MSYLVVMKRIVVLFALLTALLSVVENYPPSMVVIALVTLPMVQRYIVTMVNIL